MEFHSFFIRALTSSNQTSKVQSGRALIPGPRGVKRRNQSMLPDFPTLRGINFQRCLEPGCQGWSAGSQRFCERGWEGADRRLLPWRRARDSFLEVTNVQLTQTGVSHCACPSLSLKCPLCALESHVKEASVLEKGRCQGQRACLQETVCVATFSQLSTS